jgi:ankyrin repeat protein
MKSKYNTSFKSLNKNPKEYFFKDKISPTKLEEILKNNPSLINSINERGETILSNSLNTNNFEIFEILLNSPILDLKYKDNEGNSYLHLAVLNQNEKIVKALIKKGINLNMQNKNGNTALHLAYKYRNDSIIETLTYNGINTLIKNKDKKIAKEIKQIEINKNKSAKYNNFMNKTASYKNEFKLTENILKSTRKNGNENTNNKISKQNIDNDIILKLNSKYFRNNPYFIIKKDKDKENHDNNKDKIGILEKNGHIRNIDNLSNLESCNTEEDKNIKIMSFKNIILTLIKKKNP